jgi:putative ABC transport system substrate-binding protein
LLSHLLKPDIIVAATTASVIAAKKLTDTIPIVCENLTNPIEFGVAASYARPGSNVTGVLLTVEDLPTKLLALALELIPGAHKIGLLVHSDINTAGSSAQFRCCSQSAKRRAYCIGNRLPRRSACGIPASGARARQGGSNVIGFHVP